MTQSATEAQPKAKKNKLSSGFFRFVLTRFLLIIPTVFILVTIVFFVMRATGDPISAALAAVSLPRNCRSASTRPVMTVPSSCSTSIILAACCTAISAPH